MSDSVRVYGSVAGRRHGGGGSYAENVGPAATLRNLREEQAWTATFKSINRELSSDRAQFLLRSGGLLAAVWRLRCVGAFNCERCVCRGSVVLAAAPEPVHVAELLRGRRISPTSERPRGSRSIPTFLESNNSLFAKLNSPAGANYDIVIPSQYWVGVEAERKLLQKLDKKRIPYSYIDKKLWRRCPSRSMTMPFRRIMARSA